MDSFIDSVLLAAAVLFSFVAAFVAQSAALRLILSACHATVVPNQLALSFADQAYDEMDHLKHPADSEALKALVRQLIDQSQRMM